VLECVRASDGRRVALKALNAPPSLRAEGLLEAELLALAARASPYVVPLLDLLDDGPHVCLVMELLGPTLRQLLEERQLCPLPLAHVASVLAQMFNALEALQIHHIVHTDVKTDNIMVVDSQEEMLFVKLIDFSCAFYKDVPQPDFYVQTRYYRAPE
ncbi:Serine/threonine-protein kinase Doa, partial [Gryllus bimaculatus]